MGEIGGNDLNYLFFQQKSAEDVKTYVPYVINAIASAIHVSLFVCFFVAFSKPLIRFSAITYVITLIIHNISPPN